jgi:hypothetical protein
MRRPAGIVLLSIAIAWLSFGLLPLALVLAGPHSDLPLQPLPTLLGLAASVLGFVLARQLWRLRATAARLLLIWIALVLSFGAFWPAIASPGSERRGAVVGVLMAFGAAAVVTAALRRYVAQMARDAA